MPSYLVNDTENPPVFDPLQYASDYVRAYCRQSFTYVEDDVVVVDPWPDSSAWLPEWPVESVSNVQAWLFDPSTGAFSWTALTNWAWTTQGRIYDTTPVVVGVMGAPYPSWPKLPESLRVTYTHGFQTIPDDLQSVVLRIAADVSDNPGSVHSEKVGDVTTVWANNPVAGTAGAHVTLRDQDKAILDKYSRVSIA
jgi:hypothetical protein